MHLGQTNAELYAIIYDAFFGNYITQFLDVLEEITFCSPNGIETNRKCDLLVLFLGIILL